VEKQPELKLMMMMMMMTTVANRCSALSHAQAELTQTTTVRRSIIVVIHYYYVSQVSLAVSFVHFSRQCCRKHLEYQRKHEQLVLHQELLLFVSLVGAAHFSSICQACCHGCIGRSTKGSSSIYLL